MNDSRTIVIVGSLNADLTVRTPRLPQGGETVPGSPLSVHPGGKSSNQAVAAALLGASVHLVGAVGADANGRMLVDAARRAGVDVSNVVTPPEAITGTAVIIVDDHAENVIVISAGANGELSPDHVPSDLLRAAAVVCLALEVPLPTVTFAAVTAAAAGAEVILNLSPYQPVPRELLDATSVVILNEHELAQLTGASAADGDWERVRTALVDMSVTRAVVTLGAAGCVVIEDDVITRLPAPKITAVDTTGSGDAFTGALAAGLASGVDLVASARLGGEAGAYAATGQGAQASYATSDELRAWTSTHPGRAAETALGSRPRMRNPNPKATKNISTP